MDGQGGSCPAEGEGDPRGDAPQLVDPILPKPGSQGTMVRARFGFDKHPGTAEAREQAAAGVGGERRIHLQAPQVPGTEPPAAVRFEQVVEAVAGVDRLWDAQALQAPSELERPVGGLVHAVQIDDALYVRSESECSNQDQPCRQGRAIP